MKKLFYGFLLIGVIASLGFAYFYYKGNIIESKDEISCTSFNYMEFAMQGMEEYKDQQYGAAMLRGWMQNADCKNITEGMDLIVIKTVPFEKSYAGKTQSVLVKLPTGMTTWIAR